jgi:hypothetical protein
VTCIVCLGEVHQRVPVVACSIQRQSEIFFAAYVYTFAPARIKYSCDCALPRLVIKSVLCLISFGPTCVIIRLKVTCRHTLVTRQHGVGGAGERDESEVPSLEG